jgi:hypothetical protein
MAGAAAADIADADLAARQPHGGAVAVISPAANGAPLPEMRPLTMTSPVSGRRRRV